MRKQSHFRFNKQERSGIFFLLLIVILLQGGYYFAKANTSRPESRFVLDASEQAKIDSLKIQQSEAASKIYPFNPNYISDYRGYSLGLSTVELDKLFGYREQGNFVNSASEFQKVTGISDSLLNALSPYFKFPDWTHKNQNPRKTESKTVEKTVVKDLNGATAEDLEAIYGIGKTLSARIIKFRDRLGGFLANEQLYDVYGLEPEVVEKTLLKFQVLKTPSVEKININKASVDELSRLVYIPKTLAYNMISYRNQNGPFETFEDLKKVDTFPSEKLDRIALYLSL
ncbi:ComEA family DNA-binding protein [Flagellimonas crocea]|uniref:ComEA family DNA-binding protein n=1 Tax=Flagellimonas crocea TaxID=3067311 RepID=UPI00296F168D|nr:helix-hairpin-helix domain-containing protein [Muricauda sp. DH64]